MKRRLSMLALLIAGLSCGWVASAAGDLPQLPPLPPAPKVPTLPLLPPPAQVQQVPPVSVPKVPAAPPVSHPSLPVRVGAAAGPSQSSSGGIRSSVTQARTSSAGPTKVYRLHLSRDWIARTGPKEGRQTVLSFVLRGPALVEFVIFRISPDCRRLGRFRVRGRRGLNRVRFRGRIGRSVLGPGTYRIKARVLPARRTLAEKRLVVVSRVNRGDVAAARGADACATSSGNNASSGSTATSGGSSHQASAGAAAGKKPTSKPGPSRSHGVLGQRFTKEAVAAVKKIPLWLFVLLGLAIALLAVAALPLRAAPNGRSAAVLAHRRGVIALAGAAALVTVTLAYALH